MAILDKVKNAWNAFLGTDENWSAHVAGGSYYSDRPDRRRSLPTNEKTIVTSIYNRMSVDVAAIDMRHIKTDDNGRYSKDMDSALNRALTLEPNLDQGPRAFRQDIAMTLFEKGCAAIVPVDTSVNPATSERFDIHTLRVGEVVAWYPKHVRVRLYNELTGEKEEITLEKRFVAIVENPLYSVMNEPNSTLQRLIRKLALLDAVDEQSGSGKLDLIIQLPYAIKSEARRQQAEKRREEIEFQLKGSQYGIAYTDGTEKVTQLNRPAENNLLKQVEYLTNMLYGQLGITEEIMNSTASEEAMTNYFVRSTEPILAAIREAMQRAFLGPVGTSNNEKIVHFKDPFRLVSVGSIADIADKFTRNEILTSNEIRQYMGIPPSDDPKADKLINSNMPVSTEMDRELKGLPPSSEDSEDSKKE